MMKYTSIIALVFLLIVFPVVSNSQTKRKSGVKKTQNIKKISDEVKVKSIANQIIDGFFVKKDHITVFQKFFSISPCDKTDKEVVEHCLSEEFSYDSEINQADLDEETRLKIMAAEFKHIFQEFYFILGTQPIIKGESYPYSSLEYDELESEVLKNTNKSDYDGSKLNKSQVEKMYIERTKILNKIEKAVFSRIDNNLYQKNLKIMRESMQIIKVNQGKRIYYAINLEGLIFTLILSKRNGEFKVIGVIDGI